MLQAIGLRLSFNLNCPAARIGQTAGGVGRRVTCFHPVAWDSRAILVTREPPELLRPFRARSYWPSSRGVTPGWYAAGRWPAAMVQVCCRPLACGYRSSMLQAVGLRLSFNLNCLAARIGQTAGEPKKTGLFPFNPERRYWVSSASRAGISVSSMPRAFLVTTTPFLFTSHMAGMPLMPLATAMSFCQPLPSKY